MQGVACQEVGWKGRRLADRDLRYRGVARRLCVLFALPTGMRKMGDENREPHFSSVGVSPEEGISRRRGVPVGWSWSWSDGSGTVRAAGSARVGGESAAVLGSRRSCNSSGRWPGGPAGPEAIVDSRRCHISCCC